MLLTTIEVASFDLINMPARSGIETNPGPTNSNTLEWFEKIQKEGKVSEEKLKAEAQIFFKTDFKEDKKLVKRKVLELVKKRNNLLLQVQRKLQKYLGGQGNHFEKAPVDFGLQITDERKRNSEFVKLCRTDVRNSDEYVKWLNEECSLMVDSKTEILRKIQTEKEKVLEAAKESETSFLQPCFVSVKGLFKHLFL